MKTKTIRILIIVSVVATIVVTTFFLSIKRGTAETIITDINDKTQILDECVTIENRTFCKVGSVNVQGGQTTEEDFTENQKL